MQEQITQDGSTTYISPKFNEAYHSSIGAYTEALEKHVRACQIPELAAKQDELKILDICFGLGYNSGVAILEALKIKPEIKIQITALENDIEILQQITNLKFEDPNYQKVNDQLAQLAGLVREGEASLTCENIEYKVLLNDARKSVKTLYDDYYDAVFFDPFSPKVCPELWQPDFVADVVSTAKQGAYISTYSSARITKDSFEAAGCELHEGPKLNRRNGGVLARKL